MSSRMRARLRSPPAALVLGLISIAVVGFAFWSSRSPSGDGPSPPDSGLLELNHDVEVQGDFVLTALPEPPSNEVPSSAWWTGTEVLFWATRDGFEVVDEPVVGLALDLETKSWRWLPPRIGPDDHELAAVDWTGSTLVVCCGAEHHAEAYDIQSDSWRRLSPPPIRGKAVGVWTGEWLLVATAQGAAAYAPDTDTWKLLPDPPELDDSYASTWDGRFWYLWPNASSRTAKSGQYYDEVLGRWDSVSQPPADLWPAVPSVAVVGNRLVVIGGLPANEEGASERLVAAAVSLGAQVWVDLEVPLVEPVSCECNLGSQTVVGVGRELFVYAGALASGVSQEGVLLVYASQRDEWSAPELLNDPVVIPVVEVDDSVLFRNRADQFFLYGPVS